MYVTQGIEKQIKLRTLKLQVQRTVPRLELEVSGVYTEISAREQSIKCLAPGPNVPESMCVRVHVRAQAQALRTG